MGMARTGTGKTLFDKVWEQHVVKANDDGSVLLYIDRHLVHEVTSPQAFEGLRMAGRKPWRTSAAVATPDHNVPTTDRASGIVDPVSRTQVEALDLRRGGPRGHRHAERRQPQDTEGGELHLVWIPCSFWRRPRGPARSRAGGPPTHYPLSRATAERGPG